MSLTSLHASARFGLGPDQADMAAMGNDPRGWLDRQITHASIPPVLQALGTDNQTLALYQSFFEGKKERKEAKENGGDVNKMQKVGQLLRRAYIDQTSQRFLAQVQSTQPFIERLLLFWSNHFTVSVKKPVITGLVNPYEVQAIRPHITGNFADMLIAVAQHPAMLMYLDNIRSVGPHSQRGLRRNKNINENLGREILELHTLGVDGGYTQNDVIALANIITGWSLDISGGMASPRFTFQPALHEPGPKILLGKTYSENGVAEGTQALRDLAVHPATAKHISYKLAQHFIADEPPAQCVEELTRVYLQSNGDLPSVYRSLLNMDQAWNTPMQKFKNSYDFLVSACRLQAIEPNPKQLMGTFKSVNYLPFSAPSPAGLPDTAIYWSGSDALLKRIEWARMLSRNIRVTTNSLQIAEDLFGSALRQETARTIKGAASPQDAFAFLITSPEFQRR